ncbi:MAG: Tol-Pal system beta propeller repeat protein TolB [Gammaproteobacteria bacterium]|nr:Tol-Pal system beta propeller repeat protein TolB [Gammaproteobacteria bacterium]MBU1654255.1 Tol-Pal system beta propeller repeat protein TolB [Gammaproteobacteria bacterium]MBU1960403.1 Tol-Pal system beta propeller repeat protein TolB [Gammaproteobacteria bacterium]
MKRPFTLLLLMLLAAPAWSLTIQITGGAEGATPIAVIPFGWSGSGEPPMVNLGEVVATDLKRSGRFRTLDDKDMVAKPQVGSQVDFQDWRALKQDYLVVGQATPSGDGYQIRFELFDVYKGQQLLGYNMNSNARDLRSTAHQIADMIYEKIIGQPGAFNTRVAYITAKGETTVNSQIALQVSDADGYNPQTIVSSHDPLMSPAWSPDGRRIAYVSFESDQPSIYVQDVFTGKRTKVASYRGINGSPAWSPDGRRLAMTLSKDGNPDIYVYDLDGGSLDRITNHFSIDTEANWSPDGGKLVFTSDRGGKPQIYEVSASGGEPKRLTFQGSYNARATYSPDGKSLAVVTQTSGGFRIGLVNLSNGSMQVLTDGRLDESPSFAPNGSMIIYATKEGGKGVLAAISVDGRVKQRLSVQAGDVREPDWAPTVK